MDIRRLLLRQPLDTSHDIWNAREHSPRIANFYRPRHFISSLEKKPRYNNIDRTNRRSLVFSSFFSLSSPPPPLLIKIVLIVFLIQSLPLSRKFPRRMHGKKSASVRFLTRLMALEIPECQVYPPWYLRKIAHR